MYLFLCILNEGVNIIFCLTENTITFIFIFVFERKKKNLFQNKISERHNNVDAPKVKDQNDNE